MFALYREWLTGWLYKINFGKEIETISDKCISIASVFEMKLQMMFMTGLFRCQFFILLFYLSLTFDDVVDNLFLYTQDEVFAYIWLRFFFFPFLSFFVIVDRCCTKEFTGWQFFSFSLHTIFLYFFIDCLFNVCGAFRIRVFFYICLYFTWTSWFTQFFFRFFS